jgi:uncharacterized protein YjeT (DUF2065 family)
VSSWLAYVAAALVLVLDGYVALLFSVSAQHLKCKAQKECSNVPQLQLPAHHYAANSAGVHTATASGHQLRR